MGKGRPRKGEDVLGSLVSVYLSESEAAQLRGEAAAAGLSLSDLVRLGARKLARGLAVPAIFEPGQVDRLASASAGLNEAVRAVHVRRLEGRPLETGATLARLEEVGSVLADVLEAAAAAAAAESCGPRGGAAAAENQLEAAAAEVRIRH